MVAAPTPGRAGSERSTTKARFEVFVRVFPRREYLEPDPNRRLR